MHHIITLFFFFFKAVVPSTLQVWCESCMICQAARKSWISCVSLNDADLIALLFLWSTPLCITFIASYAKVSLETPQPYFSSCPFIFPNGQDVFSFSLPYPHIHRAPLWSCTYDFQQVPPFSHVEAYLILRCSTPLLCQGFHLKAYSQAFVPLYMHSTLRVKMNT